MRVRFLGVTGMLIISGVALYSVTTAPVKTAVVAAPIVVAAPATPIVLAVPVVLPAQVMSNTILAPVPAAVIFIREFDKYNDVSAVALAALSTTLYCEARGESLLGIRMVADTIRNRVHSRMFPNTWYGVTTQRKQFSCVKDSVNMFRNVIIFNQMDINAFKRSIHIAYDTITDRLPVMTSNSLFYHTTRVNPYWVRKYHLLGTVGHHQFYTTAKL